MQKYFPLFFAFVLWTIPAIAQQHEASEDYVYPTDTAVVKNLKKWQDRKFGLFMHWGTYSQWGIVESWSLCPEDEPWTQRKGPYSKDYFTYKKAYENLQTTFNPTKFNPEKWVNAAKNAGMKYVVFTTKHHDGFCMFDTHQTDYKITSDKTPFSKNPRANVAKEIFSAFRQQDFMIGAYFSKPDWHSPYYWSSYFPPKDRHVNYDPEKYPEKWQQFKEFTFNQIGELMGDYGKMDILWLDGGWVRPVYRTEPNTTHESRYYNQDINMAGIAKMARSKQPGLIIVDRTVAGEFENYTTPEQQVPDKPLDHPWESCITMGNSWSYVPGDHYKSAKDIITLLVKIVSRGGNLLLNIGPGPDGDWDPVAYQRLEEIGKWMKVNSEGIYYSKAVPPYSEGNIYYTQSAAGNTIYAYVLDDSISSRSLTLHVNDPKKIKKITLLQNGKKVKWKAADDALNISLPAHFTWGNVLKIEY